MQHTHIAVLLVIGKLHQWCIFFDLLVKRNTCVVFVYDVGLFNWCDNTRWTSSVVWLSLQNMFSQMRTNLDFLADNFPKDCVTTGINLGCIATEGFSTGVEIMNFLRLDEHYCLSVALLFDKHTWAAAAAAAVTSPLIFSCVLFWRSFVVFALVA